MTDVHAYIDAHLHNVRKDYEAVLRIPSIGALRAHDADTKRAAEYVATMLRECQLEHVEIIPTAGQPLVYADWLHAPGKPTVLLYAHYDVQPVDPIAEWHTNPFEPTLVGDEMMARGATDDKCQLVTTIHAVGALLDATGTLPVNVRFLIEGEEESSGVAIEEYVQAHPERLTSDIVLVADGGMAAPNQPAIHYGCRGILYTEIVAHGPARDLHSGSYGGNAPNPLFALAQIVTGLKDHNGNIAIPGLYELMLPVPDAERAEWASHTINHEEVMRAEIGTDLAGEPGYTILERAWARPTLEVHGFVGGFQQEGSKTVIPAEAKVKVSVRLVPGQTPDNVLPLLHKRVAALTPTGIRAEVVVLGGGLPFHTALDTPAIQATSTALREEFGVRPWLSRAGGSVPISSVFQEVLKADTLVIGFGLESDGAHSPNEHFHLPSLYKSVHAFARILTALGGAAAGG